MDLYALPPEQFTAARDAGAKAARAAGDKDEARQLAAQRRPAVSAYVINCLVRQEPELLTQLLELGPQLAAAQSAGEGATLRSLDTQRRALVEAVAEQAGTAAGRELTAATRDEVVQTLQAALADPASGAAVRSGRLVRPLSYAGFGAVDLDGAVASAGSGRRAPGTAEPAGSTSELPEATTARTREARQEGQARGRRLAAVRVAEADVLAAAGRLDDAVRALATAEQQTHRATEDVALAHAAEQAAAAALQAARDRTAATEARLAAVRQLETEREGTVRQAQTQAAATRRSLDALRRGASQIDERMPSAPVNGPA